MKIVYINRNPQCGFSIHKVFENIIPHIAQTIDVSSFDVEKKQGNLKDVIYNIKQVKSHLSEKKDTIYHITGDVHYLTLATLGKKTIVTVHDIGRIKNIKGIKRILYWLLRVFTLIFATKVVFISKYAEKEVLSYIYLPKKQFCIIPDAVGDEFQFYPKQFNSHKPIILHIGTRPHKNLTRTIKALESIPCHLRIIGQISQEEKAILNRYNIEFSIAYGLEDKELLTEYQKADIINFPSIHEGFGMPIIEGQAIGRPVVTSNISPMKEVAGEGACTCDPFSVESIREAYNKIINDEVYRNKLIQQGLNNVLQYRSTIIAQKYTYLYKSL